MLECEALYDTCADIRHDDPLQCGFCVLDADVTRDEDEDESRPRSDDDEDRGYPIAMRDNRACAARGGRTLFNECPPRISRLNVASDGSVLIVGERLGLFTEPQVRLCGENCDITQHGDELSVLIDIFNVDAHFLQYSMHDQCR